MPRGRPKKSVPVEREKYIGFRIGNDPQGKYRYWNENYFGDQFDHANASEMNAIREYANKLGIPVYYFGVMDDTIEEAQRLGPNDPLPNKF
jgi:hypothetical protein